MKIRGYNDYQTFGACPPHRLWISVQELKAYVDFTTYTIFANESITYPFLNLVFLT